MLKGSVRVPIECKYSSTPKPSRGFYEGMTDLETAKGYIIAPVTEAFDLSAQITVLPINEFRKALAIF